MGCSEAHPNYLTPHEGTTTKLISPFQVQPGLRAPIWKCNHYFEENMTGLAATSVVLQNGISGLPSHLKGKHPGVLEKVNLANAEFVVLDEADRMLDMGFIADVQNILQYTAKKRQTLLFSATSSPAVNELSHKLLNNHTVLRVNKINAAAETVSHVMYPVEESRKIDLFKALLKEQHWFQFLVFTSTKQQADELMAALKRSKIDAAVCHADKSQGARRRAIADFKSAKLQVLIATEVAARGLDIQGLDYVVNYNLPYLPEDYVHRIGRTGRAGKEGYAISFVSREEENTVARIEKLISSKIKRIVKVGFEVSNRISLLKSVAKNTRNSRSNKASETKISYDKSSPYQAKKSKAKVSKIKRK